MHRARKSPLPACFEETSDHSARSERTSNGNTWKSIDPHWSCDRDGGRNLDSRHCLPRKRSVGAVVSYLQYHLPLLRLYSLGKDQEAVFDRTGRCRALRHWTRDRLQRGQLTAFLQASTHAGGWMILPGALALSSQQLTEERGKQGAIRRNSRAKFSLSPPCLLSHANPTRTTAHGARTKSSPTSVGELSSSVKLKPPCLCSSTRPT